jgi:two-component system, NarL family, sensor kinase
MKFVALVCCFVVLPFVIKAQADKHYLDSLERYLTKKDDSLKLKAISDLAWEYNSIDVSRAIRLNLQALRIAQKLKRDYAVGQAYSDLGSSYYFKRDFDSSAYYFFKALPIAKKTNNKLEMAYVYHQLGALYKERAEYQTSLKYNFTSLKLYLELKEKHQIALMYNNIGVNYEELKNYKLAYSYYQKALQINKQEKDESGIARNYIGLGNISITRNELDKAYDYYEKASVIFEKLGWGIEYSSVINNMGDVLENKGQFAQAVDKRKKALEVAVEIGDVQGQSRYNLYLADVLMKWKKFPEALKHIENVEKLRTAEHSLEIEMDLYEMSSKYYFGVNNFDKGSEYLNKFHNLKDSVYSSELSSNVAAMEVQHNTQQLRIKNAETQARNLKLSNDNLRATQQRNYMILGSLILLLLGVVIFYFSNQKLKRQAERKRISAVLQSEATERTRIARDLHDGLGQLLSSARINAAALDGSVEEEDEPILGTAIQLIDQAIGEVRVISHNLMPQALADKGIVEALQELADKTNAAKSTQINFTHPPLFTAFSKEIQVTIYRVVQEIVGNMLKHAQASEIRIELSVKGNSFNLLVSDNGKGFDPASLTESDGMGWNNIQTRLSLINAKFTLESGIGKGTSVTITGEI